MHTIVACKAPRPLIGRREEIASTSLLASDPRHEPAEATLSPALSASQPFLELARGLDDNCLAFDLVLDGLRKVARVGADLLVLHIVLEGDE